MGMGSLLFSVTRLVVTERGENSHPQAQGSTCLGDRVGGWSHVFPLGIFLIESEFLSLIDYCWILSLIFDSMNITCPIRLNIEINSYFLMSKASAFLFFYWLRCFLFRSDI